MYRVVQIHRTRYGESTRHWVYKSESGAKRRVWLCNQCSDNIKSYFYSDFISYLESKDVSIPSYWRCK